MSERADGAWARGAGRATGLGEGGAVCGVELEDGRRLPASAVVITTGTFLSAVMHIGEEQRAGGRVGEASSEGLSGELVRLGLELGRLKTGTPPRLASEGIDWDSMEAQPGDAQPTPFSFATDVLSQKRPARSLRRVVKPPIDTVQVEMDIVAVRRRMAHSQLGVPCPDITDILCILPLPFQIIHPMDP